MVDDEDDVSVVVLSVESATSVVVVVKDVV